GRNAEKARQEHERAKRLIGYRRRSRGFRIRHYPPVQIPAKFITIANGQTTGMRRIEVDYFLTARAKTVFVGRTDKAGTSRRSSSIDPPPNRVSKIRRSPPAL